MRKLVAEMLKREEREKKIEDGMETLRNVSVVYFGIGKSNEVYLKLCSDNSMPHPRQTST